ncbi:MAG: hypothetical protein NTY38_16670 [Acidobacteria bacterium]|nr:hypothetical protein [Acidobacteriota bacterium]
MIERVAAALVFAVLTLGAAEQPPVPARPTSGPVAIMKVSEVKRGMQGYAWTVFAGMEPEAVPVEVIGLLRNQGGPKQDIILAKMGGKAIRTNVAAGMSGSPVYINGKLVGAVALQYSFFSPDAICGITPIESMLEINDFDNTRPSDARVPNKAPARAASEVQIPSEMLASVLQSGAADAANPAQTFTLRPIDTPLSFSGFTEETMRNFAPVFSQLGMSTTAAGGASGATAGPTPAAGWQNSLKPGDAVAGILVSGDMSVTGLGTVTYNDGKRVLAFGHPFFNLGPVEMPMAKADVLMVLASQYQPHKFGNAGDVLGALKQDRHSGIMGLLGETSATIPVTLRVRSFGENNTLRREKNFTFNVFVQQQWTPYLMMLTLFNSISGLNDFAQEATYRLSGKVELAGQKNLSLSTMQAPTEMPVPAPMLLAGWWGDKFNRLYGNSVSTPRLKRVDATIDLLPERRIATIENAWVSSTEVEPGGEIPVRVFLRPYRGVRIERNFSLRLPAGITKGDHRILLSDADTLNRMQSAAGMMNRFMDLPETVSLINQERSNNKLYVSLVQARPTVYYDDKTLPSLPASVLNVMQTGRSSSRGFLTSPESAVEQLSIPFDQVVNGSYSLKITVK